jgi:ribosomal protein L3
MEIKAKIEKIFSTQQVTQTFRKREFVVEFADNPQYPEFVKFEMIQDKCDLLDQFAEGQTINISFNLKGRKWTDPKGEVKYFNTLQAWRISPESQSEPAPISSGQSAPPPAAQDEPDWLTNDESDDLPF